MFCFQALPGPKPPPQSIRDTLGHFWKDEIAAFDCKPPQLHPDLAGDSVCAQGGRALLSQPRGGPGTPGQGESVPKSPWAQFQASLPTSARAKCTEVVRVLSQCSPRAISGVTGAAPAHNDSGITPNPSLSMPGVSECPSQAPFLAQRFLWILITLNTN